MKKQIPSFLLTFLLSLTLLIMFFLIIINKTILNEKYVLKIFENTNYYSKIYQDLTTEIQDYITQSGLEKLKISELFTVERVEKDVNEFINYLYNGQNYQSKENLKLDLENKLIESNLDLSEEEQELVITAFQNLTNNYASVVIYDSFAKYTAKLANVIDVTQKFIVPSIIVLGIFMVISIVGLIGLNKFKGSLKYIGISFFTSCIIFLGLNIFAKTNMNLTNLLIFNEAISEVIRIILNDILKQIKNIGIIFFLLGLCLTIVEALKFKIKSDN